MTPFESQIAECRDVMISHQINVIGRSRLSSAIANAETARAALCDVRNHLASVCEAIDRTLTNDRPEPLSVAFHGFADPAYGKLQTLCAASRFREAMANLASARRDAENEIAEFRALLRRTYA